LLFFFKKRQRRRSPVVNQRASTCEKAGIGGAFANTSGFFSNAVVGQAVDDRKLSWLHRFRFSRKSVAPEKDSFLNESGKKKLRRFSLKRNSTSSERGTVERCGY